MPYDGGHFSSWTWTEDDKDFRIIMDNDLYIDLILQSLPIIWLVHIEFSHKQDWNLTLKTCKQVKKGKNDNH